MAAGPLTGRARTQGVWTGSKLAIWGGVTGVATTERALGDGAFYDPVSDAWTRMAPAQVNQPPARSRHSTVWTGSEIVIWGGLATSSALDDGARYQGAVDQWAATSTTNRPEGRYLHGAVWTGSEVLIWGGGRTDGIRPNRGGRYNPATNVWQPLEPAADTPVGRLAPSVAWTGSELVVWGGTDGLTGIGSGGRYNPTTGAWRTVAVAGQPSPRYNHVSVWTGSELVVWGGQDTLTTAFDNGARYDPEADTWRPMSRTGAPAARSYASHVLAGEEILIWGGGIGSPIDPTGARYRLRDDSWVLMSQRGAPAARQAAVTVWTGSEMLVWGGFDGDGIAIQRNDGGRYRP